MDRRDFLRRALVGGAGLVGVMYPSYASALFGWGSRWNKLPDPDDRGNLNPNERLAAQYLDELIERGTIQGRDLRPVADALWRGMGKNDGKISEGELYILKTVASKDSKYPQYPEYATGKTDGDHSDYTGEAAIRALRPDFDIEAFYMLHEKGIKGGLIDASLGLEVKEVLIEPNLHLSIGEVGYNLVKEFPNPIRGNVLPTPLSRVDAYRTARKKRDVDCEVAACLAITALENNEDVKWARLWWGNFSEDDQALRHRSCVIEPNDKNGIYSVFDIAEEGRNQYARWFPNIESFEEHQKKIWGMDFTRPPKIWPLNVYIAKIYPEIKLLESVVIV